MGVILGHLNRYLQPARTYYVDATAGNDGNTGTSPALALKTVAGVNTLLLTAKAGDRVLFKAAETWSGTRLEVYCRGAPGRPILLGSYGAGAKPILTKASGNVMTNFAGSRFVVFNGLSFVGTGTASEIVQAYGSHLVWIDCEATGGSTIGSTGFKIYGTVTTDNTGYQFIRCISHHNKGSGFNTSGGSIGGLYDVLFDGCTSYSNGLAGDEGDHGIYLGRTLSGIIRDSVCYSNMDKGIIIRDSCTNVLAERNTCYSNGGPGIQADACVVGSNIRLLNNLCYSNTTSGIMISTGGNSVVVYHNTCVNNLQYGIQFEDATSAGCLIRNNLCQQDTAVVPANKVPIKIRAGNEAVNTFNNNLYFCDGDAGSHVGTRDATLKDMAEWQALGIDAASVNADAVFVTEFTNLRLQAASPARNAGAALGVVADRDMVARDLVSPDVGCYEYV